MYVCMSSIGGPLSNYYQYYAEKAGFVQKIAETTSAPKVTCNPTSKLNRIYKTGQALYKTKYFVTSTTGLESRFLLEPLFLARELKTLSKFDSDGHIRSNIQQPT